MQTHLPTHARPFLRWAGGKQRIASTLWRLLPQATRLIEPFLGAGGSFLSSPSMPGGYVLNDDNRDLMNLWRWVREDPKGLIDSARPLFTPESNNADSYLALRAHYNRATAPQERARCLLALNHASFNGLYRVNKRGEFNTPFGHRRTLTLPEHAIRVASQRLQNATLVSGDFERVFTLAGEGDLVYADPPYLPAKDAESGVANYTAGGFGFEDHQRLVNAARAAVTRGAVVAISNHDTDLSRSLYHGFSLHTLAVQRSISAKPSARVKAAELLAILAPA